MEDMVLKAKIFATQAHALVEQKRKYTGEDYIVQTYPLMTHRFPKYTKRKCWSY